MLQLVSVGLFSKDRPKRGKSASLRYNQAYHTTTWCQEWRTKGSPSFRGKQATWATQGSPPRIHSTPAPTGTFTRKDGEPNQNKTDGSRCDLLPSENLAWCQIERTTLGWLEAHLLAPLRWSTAPAMHQWPR